MKSYKFIILAICTFLLFRSTTYSQTNQWGDPVFETRLSISFTNQLVHPGSAIDLKCVTKNFSTNTVCFIRTDWRGMYEIDLVSDSGKKIKLNDPLKAGDSMSTMGGVADGESFELTISASFDHTILPGHYNLMVKQKVYLIKNFDRKNMTSGELVSNTIKVDVQ